MTKRHTTSKILMGNRASLWEVREAKGGFRLVSSKSVFFQRLILKPGHNKKAPLPRGQEQCGGGLGGSGGRKQRWCILPSDASPALQSAAVVHCNASSSSAVRPFLRKAGRQSVPTLRTARCPPTRQYSTPSVCPHAPGPLCPCCVSHLQAPPTRYPWRVSRL